MKIQLDKIDLPERDLRASVDEDELDELANSLRDHGQFQGIGVKEKIGGRYEVVFGARRTRAARLIGWTEINAELADDDDRISTDAKKLIENVQRQQLTPIEEAFGLEALIGNAVADVRSLQRQTGKSRAWITSRIELLTLPEDLQTALQAGMISLGVAKAFGGIKNDEVRRQYLQHAIASGCTTETAVAWANQSDFAEVGVLTMEAAEEAIRRQESEPQIVTQKWNCFCCHEAKEFHQLSMYTLCRGCSEKINPQTTSPSYRASPPPLDNGATME